MGMRVLSTRRDLPGGGLARLASRVDLVCGQGADSLPELAAGVDAILCLGNDRVDAVSSGQPQIHQRHIGAERPKLLHCLRDCSRLGHELHVLLGKIGRAHV